MDQLTFGICLSDNTSPTTVPLGKSVARGVATAEFAPFWCSAYEQEIGIYTEGFALHCALIEHHA